MGSISVMKTLRVGIIGCGEITQTVHIPTLNFLSDYYRVTYLCDVSSDALEHCQSKALGQPKITNNVSELCQSSDVEAVIVANSSEYHAAHAILALENNKYVLVEKPMCLTLRDADEIISAENKSQGKVFVGYMRRYAPALVDAVEMVGGFDQVTYARVRDIIGPNPTFVGQSGTFPKKFNDFRPEDTKDLAARSEELLIQALERECKVQQSPQAERMWRGLNLLGSHDISAMREVLGMPQAVLGSYLGSPIWNALFLYPGFPVSYESGLDEILRFDAHIEIYSPTKTIRVQFDSPYIKGLPVTLHIAETIEGTYKETILRKTYEDPYTSELKEFYASVVEGKNIKTTAKDARQDLEIFGMIMRSGFPTIDDAVSETKNVLV